MHWTNDAGPLTLVVWAPDEWQTSATVLQSEVRTDVATSAEERVLDFEIVVPADAAAGDYDVEGYATYFVCEGAEGECLVRRQDYTVTIPVGSPAGR